MYGRIRFQKQHSHYNRSPPSVGVSRGSIGVATLIRSGAVLRRAAATSAWGAPAVTAPAPRTRRGTIPSSRGTTPVPPISVIPSVRITVPLSVIRRMTSSVTVVSVVAVAMVPVTMITAGIPMATVGGAAMTHVFTRCRGMGAICHRVVDADTTAIEVLSRVRTKPQSHAKQTYDAVQFLNTSGGLFNGRHPDETESTRAVGLDKGSEAIQARVGNSAPSDHKQW